MKKFLFIFVITLMCLPTKAQTPYYYFVREGDKENISYHKEYLSYHTEYAFLSVKEPKLPVEMQQRNIQAAEWKYDKSENVKIGTGRFYTELRFGEKLTDEQYLNLLSELKRKNKDIIIAPYFKNKTDEKIGLSNYFYVKLKDEADSTLLMKMAEQTKCIVMERVSFLPLWYVLSITEASELNAFDCSIAFYESGLFQSTEADLMVDIKGCVDDPFFGQQWGLKNTVLSGGITVDIKACSAWQISTGSNVIVAVVDEGIERDHPDLSGNMHPLSFDCENRLTFTAPQNAPVYGPHGTPCAGIVGALQNNFVGGNREGISGVAPNCQIMNISRTLKELPNRLRLREDLAWGIDQARLHGADVISCSWGGNALAGQGPTDWLIEDAIDFAAIQGRSSLGCVIIACSQNDGASVVFPAYLNNVLAVGAIDRKGIRANFSNYGNNLNVVAPGVDIYTTDRQGNAGYNTSSGTAGNYHDKFGGTSAACPHVAGIAALILSVRPDLYAYQVRYAIESTCQKINENVYYLYLHNLNHLNGTWNSEVGHGLVDAYSAVKSVLQSLTINGSGTVCYAGNTFSLSNPTQPIIQPSNLTWTVTVPFSFSSSSSVTTSTATQPTVYRIGTGTGTGTLTAKVGNVTAATKTLTPCETSITGPTTIGIGTTHTFTVNNAPPSYTWESSSHLTPVQNNPGKFTAANTGNDAWVRIIVNNATVMAKHDVTITAPADIDGSSTVCTSSCPFTLIDPPSGTITWSVTSPFTYTPVYGYPEKVNVYKVEGGSSNGMLSAFVDGTIVAVKTITPCSTLVVGPDCIVSGETSNFSLVNCGQAISWTVAPTEHFELISSTTTSATVKAKATAPVDQPGVVVAHLGAAGSFSKNYQVCTPYISGSSDICKDKTTSVTYPVIFLPSQITDNQVYWTCSSNLQKTNGDYGKYKTFNVVGTGSGWVKANISPLNLLLTQNVTIATRPTYTTDNYVPPPNITIGLYPPSTQGVNNYKWISSTPSLQLSSSYGSSVFVTVGSPGYVEARAISSCGESPSADHVFNFAFSRSNPTSYISVYPNPVDHVLNIEIDAEAAAEELGLQTNSGNRTNLTFDVRLYDGQGTLLRQQTTKGGTVQFNVSNLLDGFYYLHIFDGVNKEPVMQQIVVEH